MLLGGFLAGPDGLRRLTEGSSIYRDDLPHLEYITFTSSAGFELPIVALINDCLDPPSVLLDEASAPQVAIAIEAIRKVNLRDVVAMTHANAGKESLDSGQLAEGIESLSKALQWNPDNLLHRITLGMALRKVGRFDEASQLFRQVLKRDKDSALAHNSLGITLAAQQKLSEAIRCFREAIRIRPDHAGAHFNLANALLMTGKLDASVHHYRKALEADPADAVTLISLGRALKVQGKHQEAARHFRQAQTLNPDLVP